MYFDQEIETYVPARHDVHYYNFIKRNAQNIQIGITNHAHLIHSDVENSITHLSLDLRHSLVSDVLHPLYNHQTIDILNFQHQNELNVHDL
jgi:ATP-dependent DNA helicase DinG